ncbi:hypothetical protein ABOM_003046 [Aspergillus bombycis]|uniref:Aminoglycoside phosphotransferase domain-containing protein n=1 Tax=Aspergillus bombycis TaxID=109264 RepID=A0A1F8AAL3_9EURO|nr:hypothetical protein ABOM_003046 [Aspergillus bombycis]OGM48756.1 hypothetical protein ABOM_003046 [Aspergillus bombycis]
MASKDDVPQPARLIYQKGTHRVEYVDGKIVKSGENFKIYEALSLIFINDNTKVPVPKVRSIHYEDKRLDVRYDEAGKSTNILLENGKVFERNLDKEGRPTWTHWENDRVDKITMDYMGGEALDSVWEDFNKDQQDVLAGDLRLYVAELRKLKDTQIAALNDGPARIISDCQQLQEGGPFRSREEFNNFLRENSMDMRRQASWDDSSQEDDSSQDDDAPRRHEEFFFTHGDIVPRNIPVDGQGKITALVDWEFAGYYPKDWEYSRASRDPTPGWKDFLCTQVFQDKEDWGCSEMKSRNVRSADRSFY